MTETKSELHLAITKLEMQIEAKEQHEKYQRRELEKARRLFMELYDDHRTLKLRFGWLEERATDTVQACDEHRPGELQALAEELGLTTPQPKELNS